MLETFVHDVLTNPQWWTLGAIMLFGFKATRAFSRLEMKVDLLWKRSELSRGLDGQHE